MKKLLNPTDVAPTCPHLGMRDDRNSFYTYASTDNRCYNCRRPAAPLLTHQDEYCLGAAHVDCPVYWQARTQAFPAQFRSANGAKRAIFAWAGRALAIAIGLAALGFTAIRFLPQILTLLPILSVPPPPPLPTVSVNHIFVAKIWNTTLRIHSADSISSLASEGDLLDFKSGTRLETSGAGRGYGFVGFPGQAEAYLADGTELVIKDPVDAKTNIDVVLRRGILLLRLPGTFSAGQRFLVETPEGAQAWIRGSMMALQYDPLKQELYVDCLQDVCGYLDDTVSKLLPQGSHVTFKGMHVMSTGAGTRNEMWQFVPNKVPTPTLTPSATLNVTPSATPNVTPSAIPSAEATQSCRYARSLGTPCAP